MGAYLLYLLGLFLEKSSGWLGAHVDLYGAMLSAGVGLKHRSGLVVSKREGGEVVGELESEDEEPTPLTVVDFSK